MNLLSSGEPDVPACFPRSLVKGDWKTKQYKKSNEKQSVIVKFVICLLIKNAKESVNNTINY